jgi:hypothetical protein
MRVNKVALLIGFAITSVLFFEVAAHANEVKQSTKVTFSQPIEIPGEVLPAGTYLFRLPDADNLNIVQIFNSEGTRVYATLQTISTERPQPTDNTAVTLVEQGAGRPEALLKWFCPGDTDGHERSTSYPGIPA